MGRPEGIAALCFQEAADQPVGRESKKLYFGSDLCHAWSLEVRFDAGVATAGRRQVRTKIAR